MFKKALPFFMLVETPLHVGSGSELGEVDLPIQRERHTGFPKIESSGLKGSIREVFESINDKSILKEKFPSIEGPWEIERDGKKEIKKDKHGNELTRFDEAISLAFGPEEGDAHSGALGFTDARLLLFPVKSMKGVFAWITCPYVLERFKNELKLTGQSLKSKDEEQIKLPNTNSIIQGSNIVLGSKVVLEEYTFTVMPSEDLKTLAEWLAKSIFPQPQNRGNDSYSFWREKMKKDVVVLSDDDFRDFVNLATEVITRIKIDPKTGTVQEGALFSEEYLPQESVLYSLALATPIFVKNDEAKGIFKQDGKKEEELVLDFFKLGLPEIIQIGGNATIGKGIVRIKVREVQNE